MKNRSILIYGLTAYIFLFAVNLVAGENGTAYGVIRDSGGNFPAGSELSFVAYIQSNPSQSFTQDEGGNDYLEGTGNWIVDLSQFDSWKDEILVVEFTDADGPTGVETGSISGELTSSSEVTYDFGDASLPVQLTSFIAISGDGFIELQWQTESETDNLGFNIYRSELETGDYVRITSELINGQGSSTNTTEYTYIDSNVENGTTYFYKIEDVDINGLRNTHGPISGTPQAPTGIKTETLPTEFALDQNYPNPFNPGTVIAFDLPATAHVSLTVYNLLGQKVLTLIDSELAAGHKTAIWDARDGKGDLVPAGLYIYRMVADDFIATKKMLLIK